jgi:hypothetical protein
VTHETSDFALIKLPGVDNNTTPTPRYLIVEEAIRHSVPLRYSAVLENGEPHGNFKSSVSTVTTNPVS